MSEMNQPEQLGGERKEHSQEVRKLEVFHSNHVRRPEIMMKKIDQKIPHHERYG
jgi:hypothetical protein